MSDVIENGKADVIRAAFIGYEPPASERPMASVVEQYLSDMAWDYKIERAETNHLVLTTTILVGCAACRTLFDINDNASLFGVRIYLPIKVPEEKRAEMVAYLTRVNYHANLSRIVLNLTSGKIHSICDVTIKGSCLSYSMVSHMRSDVHMITETCLPGILSIIYGNAPAEGVWRSLRAQNTHDVDALGSIPTANSVDQDSSKSEGASRSEEECVLYKFFRNLCLRGDFDEETISAFTRVLDAYQIERSALTAERFLQKTKQEARVALESDDVSFLDIDIPDHSEITDMEDAYRILWYKAQAAACTQSMASLRLSMIKILGEDRQRELIGLWK